MVGQVPANRVKVRNDNFDYKKFIRLCIARWWWFAISLVITLVAVFLFMKLKPQPEIVKGSVLIASGTSDTKSSLLKQFDISSVLGGTGSVESEVAIMGSHEVMRMTVKELNLNCSYSVESGFFKKYQPWGDEPVKLDYNHAIADTLSVAMEWKLKLYPDQTADVTLKCKKEKLVKEKKVKLPVKYDTPYGEFALTPTEAYEGYFKKTSSIKESVLLVNYSASAERLQKAVLITPYSKKVYLVNLSLSTYNAQYGIDVMTALVNNYNQLGIENQREAGLRTIRFIDERIAELSEDLSDKESQIETYTSGKQVGNVEADAKRSFERSSKLQDALVQAETEYKIMLMVKDYMSDPKNKYELIPSLSEGSSKSLESAIEGYNGQIMHRMNLLKNASPDNLSVKILNDNIDAMRGNIELSLAKAIEAAHVRLQSLRSQTAQARGKELDLPETQREYLVLKRNQGIQEKLYLYLLQQREEKAMRVANVTPSGQVIDEVYVTAYAKKRSLKLYALIALVIGMGIPAAIIYLLDRMRRKVDSADEVKRLTSLPLLASVSADEVGDKASLWARPMQANLGFMLGASGGNTVMVTSMGQGERRESVAAAIAREFSRQGETTLLLQADLSHEGIRPFGVSSRAGVAEYVSGKATVADITCKVASETGLSVITAAADGVTVAQSMSIIASVRFKELLRQLKADYNVVIIDAPAIGETGGETSVIAAESDVTVLATRKGVTLISDLERLSSVNASGIYRQLSVVYTA